MVNSLVEMCQCCLSTENLKSMTEPFIVGNNIELYYDMLNKCFHNLLIRRVENNSSLFICENCIEKLRTCYIFHNQVEKVQESLYRNNKLVLSDNENVEVTYYDERDLTGLIKEEDFINNISTEETFWSGPKSPPKESNHSSVHVEILTNDDATKNIPKIRSEELPSLERRVKIALTKIKPSQILDELIANDTNIPSENHNFMKLHDKVKSLLKTPVLDGSASKNESIQSQTERKLQRSTNESYRKKCKIYLKKNRKDLKPYHLNESDNKCSICSEEFYSYQTLVAHMNEHYPQYICDKCGKGFAVRSALRAHIQIHDEGIPCEICSKKIMKRNLSKHVNAHLGKKDIHRCPLCDQRFEKFSSRALHMEKEHNIVKRYKCKWCGKIFQLAANLNLHIRDQHNPFVRMQIRPNTSTQKPRVRCFECDTCGKTFRQKLHLEHHQISKHGNEKNYQCHICLRSYFLKYSLNQHMKDYHFETSKFSCFICNKVFKVKRMVTRHIKRVHNKQSMPTEISGDVLTYVQ